MAIIFGEKGFKKSENNELSNNEDEIVALFDILVSNPFRDY